MKKEETLCASTLKNIVNDAKLKTESEVTVEAIYIRSGLVSVTNT